LEKKGKERKSKRRKRKMKETFCVENGSVGKG